MITHWLGLLCAVVSDRQVEKELQLFWCLEATIGSFINLNLP